MLYVLMNTLWGAGLRAFIEKLPKWSAAVQGERERLREEIGREPTNEELADAIRSQRGLAAPRFP